MDEPIFKTLRRNVRTHGVIENDPLYGNIGHIPVDSSMNCFWTDNGILKCRKPENNGSETGYVYYHRPGFTMFSVVRNVDTCPAPEMTLRVKSGAPPECIGAGATLEQDYSDARKCGDYEIQAFERFKEEVKTAMDNE